MVTQNVKVIYTMVATETRLLGSRFLETLPHFISVYKLGAIIPPLYNHGSGLLHVMRLDSESRHLVKNVAGILHTRRREHFFLKIRAFEKLGSVGKGSSECQAQADLLPLISPGVRFVGLCRVIVTEGSLCEAVALPETTDTVEKTQRRFPFGSRQRLA